MTLKFEDLQVLTAAEGVADDMWKIAIQWGSFAQDAVGKQVVRAADSIGANIAKAYGRYHDGEKLQFFYDARGSLFETKYWLNRGQSRGLLTPAQFQQLSNELSNIARQLNSLANKKKEQKASIKKDRNIAEESPTYNITTDQPPLFSPEELNFLQSLPTS